MIIPTIFLKVFYSPR